MHKLKVNLCLMLKIMILAVPIYAQLTQESQETEIKSSNTNSEVTTNYQKIKLYSDEKQQILIIPIFVGTPPQPFNARISTVDGNVWVPAWNCSICLSYAKFDDRRSVTFSTQISSTTSQWHKQLNYVQQLFSNGFMTGLKAQEIVALDLTIKNIQIQTNLIYEDINILSRQHNAYFGIGKNNVFEKATSQGLIQTSTFALTVNFGFVGSDSYLYYNVSQTDFPTARYQKIYDKWSAYAERITVGDKQIKIPYVLFKFGQLLTQIPLKIYSQLEIQIFNKNCDPYIGYSFQRSCSCDKSLYPNITIQLKQINITMMPQLYIKNVGLINGNCVLLIIINSDMKEGIAIADPFLNGYTVIFDSENQRIGFVDRYLGVNYLIKGLFIHSAFNFLSYIAIIAIVCMISSLCIYKDKKASAVQSSVSDAPSSTQM